MSRWIPDNLYRDIVDNMPVCTVDVAFFNGDASKVLVFRRAAQPLKGEWFTIGGRLMKNETVRDCAVRQAEVEAGLKLDPGKLFFGGVFDEIHDASRFGGTVTYHCVDVCWGYFLDEDARIQPDRQHTECQWRAVDDPEFVPMLAVKIMATRGRGISVNCNARSESRPPEAEPILLTGPGSRICPPPLHLNRRLGRTFAACFGRRWD